MPACALPSIMPLVDGFDAFILDQWGVLHDGVRAFPEALDAVDHLLAAGKVIVTLSNSGRRADSATAQMRAMGLPVERFRANVTSGEAAVAALRAGEVGGVRLPGRRCYLLCRDGDTSIPTAAGLDLVGAPAAADFVLIAGIHGEVRDLGSYLDELAPAIACGLPVVCTNPDRVAVSPRGNVLAPGGVAYAYGAAAGVDPLFVGKPHRPVYERCRRALPDVALPRICAVGDSLEHDVKGGFDAGLSTVFCLDGIHADAFDLTRPAGENLRAVERLAAIHGGVVPDYVLTRLTWQIAP
ncbi:MAG: TIGR01459 family HAD-type hydrolase [Alphaproteobacteria bacterium]